MRESRWARSGFTLAELIAVVVILGLFLQMTVPTLGKLPALWQEHVCSKNRTRVEMTIHSELERGGLGYAAVNELMTDADCFLEYCSDYGLSCPKGGNWSLERTEQRFFVACMGCTGS